MFVVFDLDGTLCNIEHRLHHIQNGNRRWDEFFAACGNDEPCEPVIEVFHTHRLVGNRVEIWSGRSDQVRGATETWLMGVGIESLYLTRMRPAGDHQPDVKLKRSWLHSLPDGQRPDVIYDDRQSVVDMWRAEGITCFQVAPGDF